MGQLLLETDYHLASTNMITVEGMPTNELLAMKRLLFQDQIACFFPRFPTKLLSLP